METLTEKEIEEINLMLSEAFLEKGEYEKNKRKGCWYKDIIDKKEVVVNERK